MLKSELWTKMHQIYKSITMHLTTLNYTFFLQLKSSAQNSKVNHQKSTQEEFRFLKLILLNLHYISVIRSLSSCRRASREPPNFRHHNNINHSSEKRIFHRIHVFYSFILFHRTDGKQYNEAFWHLQSITLFEKMAVA